MDASERYSLSITLNHTDLEQTFRQTCTAVQTSEIEFLDVTHCIATEDGLGFVTRLYKTHSERKTIW